MTSDQSRSTTQSGKYYQTNKEGDISIYNLVSGYNHEGVVKRGTMAPATSTSNIHRGKNSPTPLLLSLEEDIAMHMKLPTFTSERDEDMDQFWFIVEYVWTTQNVNNDAIERAHLSIEFEGREVDCFMGYIGQNTNASI